jgi:20S proteasome alpha/beta subunit
MTVCIAALCPAENAIVAVSDTMVSNEAFSQDRVATKIKKLAPEWLTMFAGQLSPVSPILEYVRVRSASGSNSRSEMADHFESAFMEQRRILAERTVLNAYGLSLAKFIEKGREYFGEAGFSNIQYQIEALRIDVEFLVMGFNKKAEARIFSVTDGQLAASHHFLGFHAIGTGCTSALGSLFNSRFKHGSLNECVYRVCEAKFTAELHRELVRIPSLQFLGPVATARLCARH